MIHPDDRERTAAEQRSLRAGGLETLHFRNRFVTSDGGYRWIEWSARADVDAQVTIVIGCDVTEEQDTRDTMLRHERTLSRLLARRSQERDEARIETLRRLALAAEFHDDGTAGHTERVGFTAHLIACELGAAPDWTATLRHAAPLHDVGKVAIADSILRKPGPLTPDEHRAMQAHTTAGAEILGGSDSAILRLGEEIALTHHERWDGTGYPNRLANTDIPLSGRIVAVADVFDALTHDRPYKRAWPIERALAEIRSGSGTHFEPEIAAAFCRLNPQLLSLHTPGRAA